MNFRNILKRLIFFICSSKCVFLRFTHTYRLTSSHIFTFSHILSRPHAPRGAKRRRRSHILSPKKVFTASHIIAIQRLNLIIASQRPNLTNEFTPLYTHISQAHVLYPLLYSDCFQYSRMLDKGNDEGPEGAQSTELTNRAHVFHH